MDSCLANSKGGMREAIWVRGGTERDFESSRCKSLAGSREVPQGK